MTNPVTFDRSRVVAWEKCPRLRWYLYEWQGRGLQPVRKFIPLEAGGAIHVGLAHLLKGDHVELAVTEAIREYDQYVTASGIDLTLYEGQNPQRVVDEHKALVEALLRAFALSELAKLLSEYEVLAVEREEYADFTVGDTRLRLLGRVDGLLRRRVDKAIFVLSFKTASIMGKQWRDQMTHDAQVITETLAVDARLEREGSSERVTGVIVYGLAKGRRSEYPEGSGNWYHNSPLTWAWRQSGEPPMTADKWAYRYVGPSGSRLGKGWHKVSIWDNYPGGVAEWIYRLHQGDPALLSEQFVMLPPILRTQADIDEWKRTVLRREVDISLAPKVTDGFILDSIFPRHTSGGNCVWPSRCPCYELCWGSAAADPLGAGYELRVANHPEESKLRSWNDVSTRG